MKMFHISDILSLTTGRLVSTRHMDGVYDILNFLTGDSLFTHQLPRAMKECEPWLATQFAYLFPDNPKMAKLLKNMDESIALGSKDAIPDFIASVRREVWGGTLPEMLPVYEMGADMHTHIDPIAELEAMIGKDKVIVVEAK